MLVRFINTTDIPKNVFVLIGKDLENLHLGRSSLLEKQEANYGGFEFGFDLDLDLRGKRRQSRREKQCQHGLMGG